MLGYTLFCDAPRFSRYYPSPPVQHTRRKKYQSPCHKEQLHHFSKLTSSSVSLVRVLWSMWMTLRASPFASCNALSFWDFDDRMIPFTTRTIRHNRRRMTNWAITSKPSSSTLEHKNTEQIICHIEWLIGITYIYAQFKLSNFLYMYFVMCVLYPMPNHTPQIDHLSSTSDTVNESFNEVDKGLRGWNWLCGGLRLQLAMWLKHPPSCYWLLLPCICSSWSIC